MAHQTCSLRTPPSIGRQQHLRARTGRYRGRRRVAAYLERIRYHPVTAVATSGGRGHTRMRRVALTVRRQVVQGRDRVCRRVGQESVLVSIGQKIIISSRGRSGRG